MEIKDAPGNHNGEAIGQVIVVFRHARDSKNATIFNYSSCGAIFVRHGKVFEEFSGGKGWR